MEVDEFFDEKTRANVVYFEFSDNSVVAAFGQVFFIRF